MKKTFTVAGIGEVLFDVLPEGKQLGGAPVNFTFHARTLGLDAYPVSAIGQDTGGQEVIEKLTTSGLSTEYIEQVDYPTGTAEVSLDADGVPHFTITENVAWDHIDWTKKLKVLAQKADAVCFGSLAQRSIDSRETIQLFLNNTKADCLKIFDINLRQQYYSHKIIEKSLQAANVLKLNDDELTLLRELLYLPYVQQDALRVLLERYQLQYIALTRGAEGSVLMDGQTCCDCSGFETAIVDTVGAGDSYTAVLAYGLLNQWPFNRINQVANKVAAYVCSQPGATPALSDTLIDEIQQDLLTLFKDEKRWISRAFC